MTSFGIAVRNAVGVQSCSPAFQQLISGALGNADMEHRSSTVTGTMDEKPAPADIVGPQLEGSTLGDGQRSRSDRATALLLAIAYIGFISLGLPDPVAGVAWPSVRSAFSLPQSGFGLVFIALGCGYCACGFFSGKLTQALGLGNLLWMSSGLVAVAMFGSGATPVWPLFLVSAVVWGLGSGGIDAGLNAYGSRHFSARHMNWLHACYSLGATIGPLIMTAMLVRIGSWRRGYALVGTVLLVMTVLFYVTRKRWSDPVQVDKKINESIGMRTALGNLLVWLQIVLFFLYVGLEFTVGQWSFTLLTESRAVRADVAGILAGGYYGAIGVGRVVSGVIAHRMGLDLLLRCSMLAVLIGAILFAFGSPIEVCHVGLAMIGLGLAPVFPCMMAQTPQRLGANYATHAVGFQVSAGMLGAALVPGLAGLLGEKFGLEFVTQFAVLLAAMLFINHELILRVGHAPHDGTTVKNEFLRN
jgi:fucose permease